MRNPFFRAVAGAGLLLFAGVAGASDISVRVGTGPTHVFTDAQIVVGGDRESVTFTGDGGGHALSGSFSAPRGQPLYRGVYRYAERDAFKTGLAPGVDAVYDGAECSDVWGDITIRQIAHDVDGNLTMLDATARRACEEGGVPTVMTIRYKSKAFQYGYATTPVTPPGKSFSKKYLGHSTDMVLAGTRSQITYAVSGEREEWHVRMDAPFLQQLAVGTYDTESSPSGFAAGLSVSGIDGVGCNPNPGSLTIHAIRTNSAGTVTGLNASFTVICGSDWYTGTIRHLL